MKIQLAQVTLLLKLLHNANPKQNAHNKTQYLCIFYTTYKLTRTKLLYVYLPNNLSEWAVNETHTKLAVFSSLPAEEGNKRCAKDYICADFYSRLLPKEFQNEHIICWIFARWLWIIGCPICVAIQEASRMLFFCLLGLPPAIMQTFL